MLPNRRLLTIAIALVMCFGCSLSMRPVGGHEPAVDIARANAEAETARANAQVAMMKAIVEAITRIGMPTPTPTPMPLCVSSDGVTVVQCLGVVR